MAYHGDASLVELIDPRLLTTQLEVHKRSGRARRCLENMVKVSEQRDGRTRTPLRRAQGILVQEDLYRVVKHAEDDHRVEVGAVGVIKVGLGRLGDLRRQCLGPSGVGRTDEPPQSMKPRIERIAASSRKGGTDRREPCGTGCCERRGLIEGERAQLIDQVL